MNLPGLVLWLTPLAFTALYCVLGGPFLLVKGNFLLNNLTLQPFTKINGKIYLQTGIYVAKFCKIDETESWDRQMKGFLHSTTEINTICIQREMTYA